jgi:hypothetical protein
MNKLLTVTNGTQFLRGICGSSLVAVAIGLFYFAIWMAPRLARAEDKCTICHCPPGNPNNCHTLNVGCSAVDAHLKNHPGDCLGPCPCQPTPSQNK